MEVHLFDILLIAVVSYVLGSIPTAYLIAKTRNIDIFEVGSGNMGATNVARALGFQWGLVVWFFDSVKGIAAILVAQRIIQDPITLATTIAALFVIIGHNWSIFATTLTGTVRGGKGAATAFGTLIMIAPFQVFVICFAISGLIVAITRYVSLGVLLMFILSILWIILLIAQQQMDPVFLFYGVVMLLMLFYRFRDNIQRLIEGSERRLGEPV